MASTLAAGVACWPAPTQSVTPGRALFAKGLAKGCTSAHLQAIFSTFGTVTDCQIARHRSGRSAGFAIVTFLRHEEAVAAMQAVDNLMFMGRRLSVKWFSPERALEGSSHGVDVLNMQALQHALQLSQMQPADLMAQLAQMLESPRLAAQQQQNPHVAAWLDNFVLAQQRESPLAQPIHDASQQQSPMDLLSLSALSLTDMSGQSMGMPQAPGGHGTHPATPSSMDVPDGAVFVTAGANSAGIKGGNLVIAHSRLSKWCTAPGSAGGHSSAAPSLTDDASSETASVHASDDSSIATTVQIVHVSCDGPSCCTEGSSPSAAPGMGDAPGAVGAPGANAAACSVAAPSASVHPSSVPDGEVAMRNRALAAAAAVNGGASRPGATGSDPGSMQQARRPPNHGYPGPQPILPGAPPLAPLRTVATAPATSMQHMPRTAPAQTRASLPAFNSCGGGGASASPDACLQQALRLQQALAEQARNMTAQQQYVDALAKLAAARDQVMAAASMLNNNGAMSAASLQMPQQMPSHHHHHHMSGQPGGLMGHMSGPVNPFMNQQPQGQGSVPDLGALLMLQNAAAISRPLY